MQLQNLAALAAAASAAQNTPSGTNALTTSSSPLSVLTSSGKHVTGHIVLLCALDRSCLKAQAKVVSPSFWKEINGCIQRAQIMNNKVSNVIF
jgi:hypothetical protein